MSAGEKQIRCRKCKEIISVESGSCPHCGTGIRSTIAPLAVLVLGLIITVATVINLGELWFYTLIGVAMAVVGGFLIYEKRSRMHPV